MYLSKLTTENQAVGSDMYDFDPIPELAESWEYKSPTEVIFHLRKGVKWQNIPPVNGREFTSADIKYTIDRIFDPKLKSANKAYFNKIKTIETPDPYTVRFILKEPFVPFVKYTALTYGMIVAKEAVEIKGDLKHWKSAIGTGPFILKNYIPNELAHFVRNPDYFDQPLPYVDEVKLRIMPAREVILAAFRTGQLDGIYGYHEYEEQLDLFKKNPKLKGLVYYSNSWPRMTFAVDKPPFNDKRVRQAASMSIDRKKMLDILFDGRGKVDQVIPIWQWGSLPNDQLGKSSKYFQPNIEEAKRLIKAAGYKTPLKIKFAYTPAYGTLWVSLVEALIGQLNSSRVFKLDVVSKEYGAYVTSNYRGKYKEDCFYGYTTPAGDPDEVMWDMYHSTSARNSSRVKDPHLDKLLEAQRRELNLEKRRAILKELQIYLGEQMYQMQTISQPGYDIWQPYLRGHQRHMVPAYNIGGRNMLTWLDK
jgi:peptide/nickel transport system substrate-binding protein